MLFPNAVRTLLLNQNGENAAPANFPGEEFVPATYRQRQLPLCVQGAYQALFGTNPDRLFRNYRLWQLMTLLHTTELDSNVRALDPRITYWPPSKTATFFDNVFVRTITRLSGEAQIFFTGSVTANDGTGQCMSQWRVQFVDESTVSIQQQLPLRPTPVVADYSAAGNLTSLITLPNSELSISFFNSAPGDLWLVAVNAKPQTDLGVVLAQAGTAALAQLDAIFNSTAEPIITFRNLFTQNPLAAYKYGGLILAIAYQILAAPQVQ